MVSIEIPRIMAVDWGGGADSRGRSSHRAEFQYPQSDSPSPTPSRSDAACTPSDRVGEFIGRSLRTLIFLIVWRLVLLMEETGALPSPAPRIVMWSRKGWLVGQVV
uniref:Uncharacterized protein n=1 Tax=Brassica oleracea TaxID=3712 RepID=A0A3P6G361_BRAOL|nr:unnamed protein product [Brassica oleracea]